MANIGYFVLDFNDFDNQSWGTLQTSVGDFVRDRSGDLNLSRLGYRCWALTENQWATVLYDNQDDRDSIVFHENQPGHGSTADFPYISSKTLGDLNKGEYMAKILAIVQVSYLIVQLIARRVKGLPSAQIEIAALAFAAISLVTYIFFWNQPHGVESRHIIKAKRLPRKELVKEVAMTGPACLWSGRHIERRADETRPYTNSQR